MTERCLESVIPHVNSSIYDTTLFVGDNNSNDEMKKWLDTLKSERVRVFYSQRNIGKAGIVNKMYREYGNECHYFISMDSDMIADEDYNFIDRMVWYACNMPQFGLLSTFQKENDQHLWDGLTQIESKDGFEVAFGRYNCVAGGCVILSKHMWDSIGNYDTYGNVYGYDDGLMMQAVNSKNKKCGIMKHVKLTHPYDDDHGYKNWKHKNISRRKQIGYYDENS